VQAAETTTKPITQFSLKEYIIGIKNDADAIWCQSCGQKIKGDLSVCPICITRSDAQAFFCKKCGKKLTK
jgi:hypothetical protein